jgi:hypothetical protein
MTPLIIAASIVALAVASILWLLVRLDRLQLSRDRTIFVRRWSYILSSQNYTELARRLLPQLRASLAVLAVSVIAAILSLVVFVRRQVP